VNDVPALDALSALPAAQAQAVLLDVSKTNSDQDLGEIWSIRSALVRKLRLILGIHKDYSGAITNVTAIQEDKWPLTIRLPTRRYRGRAKNVAVMLGAIDETPAAPVPAARGLTLSIEGTFDSAELEPRIEAIRALLAAAGASRYTINLSLDEVVPAIMGAAHRPK
jgi:hypothetical protein